MLWFFWCKTILKRFKNIFIIQNLKYFYYIGKTYQVKNNFQNSPKKCFKNGFCLKWGIMYILITKAHWLFSGISGWWWLLWVHLNLHLKLKFLFLFHCRLVKPIFSKEIYFNWKIKASFIKNKKLKIRFYNVRMRKILTHTHTGKHNFSYYQIKHTSQGQMLKVYGNSIW